MKKIILFLYVYGMALVALSGVLSPYHVGRVTLLVVDEQGMPVTNATASIEFSKNIPAGEGWGTRSFSIAGQTDTNGMFSAEAEGNPSVYSSARKEGYYTTIGMDFMFTNVVRDRWEPWNPTLGIVLRKIGNPIPMYAKKVEIVIPVVDNPVGYDLEVGDWVAPYGLGSVRDLIFKFKGRFGGIKDREETLTINFNNPMDGIQVISVQDNRGSVLKFPYNAPEGGYTNVWMREKAILPNGIRKNLSLIIGQNYLFRVRSVIDQEGRIKDAKYGRIRGDIEFGYAASNKVILIYCYYLNPTPNDRNLEFDPSKNLFKDLKDSERVSDP